MLIQSAKYEHLQQEDDQYEIDERYHLYPDAALRPDVLLNLREREYLKAENVLRISVLEGAKMIRTPDSGGIRI